MTQDIHLNQQQTIDGAGQESREPLSGEPIRDGLTGTDLSAAPSPVIDAPQPIVALLDAIPPEDEDPDPDWDELTAKVARLAPAPGEKTFTERMLDRMDA